MWVLRTKLRPSGGAVRESALYCEASLLQPSFFFLNHILTYSVCMECVGGCRHMPLRTRGSHRTTLRSQFSSQVGRRDGTQLIRPLTFFISSKTLGPICFFLSPKKNHIAFCVPARDASLPPPHHGQTLSDNPISSSNQAPPPPP